MAVQMYHDKWHVCNVCKIRSEKGGGGSKLFDSSEGFASVQQVVVSCFPAVWRCVVIGVSWHVPIMLVLCVKEGKPATHPG